MDSSSFCNHMIRSHGIVLPHNRGLDVGGGGPETYKMLFPWILKLEGMEMFTYMGRTLDQVDDDWPAVRQNIMYAR